MVTLSIQSVVSFFVPIGIFVRPLFIMGSRLDEAESSIIA